MVTKGKKDSTSPRVRRDRQKDQHQRVKSFNEIDEDHSLRAAKESMIQSMAPFPRDTSKGCFHGRRGRVDP